MYDRGIAEKRKGDDEMLICEIRGGDAHGSISKNRGSLQDHRSVPVLSAAGLQGRHDPARQERRCVLHQHPGLKGSIGRSAGRAFKLLRACHTVQTYK